MKVEERIAALETWTVDDPLSPFIGESVVSLKAVMAALQLHRGFVASRKPSSTEARVELDALLEQVGAICQGHSFVAIIATLEEVYARVLSHCINDDAEMEKALVNFTTHVRGWWMADRGGSFLPL